MQDYYSNAGKSINLPGEWDQKQLRDITDPLFYERSPDKEPISSRLGSENLWVRPEREEKMQQYDWEKIV